MAISVTTGTVWPNQGKGVHFQALAAVLYLITTTIFGVFIALRTPRSRAAFKSLSVAKWFVLLVFVDSWLFMFFSGVLVLGIGTSLSESACAAGIWWCIALYASSKIFIYCFLLERLHLVWKRDKEGREVTRWQSPMYRVSLVFLFAWIAVAVTMAVGRMSFIRKRDQVCVIGLRLFATVPMLVVDALVNIYLTASFVIPIVKTKFSYSKRLAFKSCAAAIVALITSFVNIVILTTQHGRQLSWVCLMSCGLDVTLNSIIIFIVTISRSTVVIQRPSEETSISIPYRPGGLGGGGGLEADDSEGTDTEKVTPLSRHSFDGSEKPGRHPSIASSSSPSFPSGHTRRHQKEPLAVPTAVRYSDPPLQIPAPVASGSTPVVLEKPADMSQDERNAETANMFKDYEQHYGELQTVLRGSAALRQGRYN